MSTARPDPPPKLGVRAGSRQPLGAAAQADGVNFAVYSPRATRVWLRLYRAAADESPLAEIELDPATHRSYGFWHVFVVGARAGWFYTWRADGPDEPAAGLRFDARRELLDPWARARQRRSLGARRGAWTAASRLRCARRSRRPTTTIGKAIEPLQAAARAMPSSTSCTSAALRAIRRPASPSPARSRGIVDKIPYLQALGITDVELLPVFAFDVQDVPAATAALGLHNFWGYSPVSFFAPHRSLRGRATIARREFRDMVKALHAAGIGVILDIVLNHTAEGGADGPTIGLQGTGQRAVLPARPGGQVRVSRLHGLRQHRELAISRSSRSGCVECLRFWAVEMHVDGFRFDLAGVLSRGEDGEPLAHAPVICGHRVRAGARRRALDRGSVGRGRPLPSRARSRAFAGPNGTTAIAMRCAASCAASPALLGELATRIAGSSDLYACGRQVAAQRHQLRHLSRRLHALRSRQLRPQAQQRQRRAQPRRPRRELQLELGRRGRHGRSRDSAAAGATRAQLHGRCCC